MVISYLSFLKHRWATIIYFTFSATELLFSVTISLEWQNIILIRVSLTFSSELNLSSRRLSQCHNVVAGGVHQSDPLCHLAMLTSAQQTVIFLAVGHWNKQFTWQSSRCLFGSLSLACCFSVPFSIWEPFSSPTRAEAWWILTVD